MPELPEVETIRRQLAPQVEGTRILHSWTRLARRTFPDIPTLVRLTQGTRVRSAQRHGKQLYFPLDNDAYLLIHLGMSGRLQVQPGGGPVDPALLPRHVHAVFALEGDRRLIFSDPRTFGAVAVESDLDFLKKVGPDPTTETFDEDALATELARRKTPIKAALLNQSLVAGLGNIYADEVCFLAGVHPAQSASSLSRSRLMRLVSHIRPVLLRGIEARGATLKDGGYQDLFGAAGIYYPYVYGNTGHPCPTCGTPIRRGVLGPGKSARSYHFCPRCQRKRSGRVDIQVR